MTSQTEFDSTQRPALWHLTYRAARNLFAVIGLVGVFLIALPQVRTAFLDPIHQLWWLDAPGVTSAGTPGLDQVGVDGGDASREILLAEADGERASGSAEGQVAHGTAPGPSDEQRLLARQREEQRAMTEFIARRYRVADEIIARFVAAAYRSGREFAIEPTLVLAVMATESRYNPIAESVVGAKGLMQVIAKYHPEKLSEFGGERALLDPEINIRVGTQILREYLRRFRDLETALQMYAGAADEPTAQYSRKVLSIKSRLNSVRTQSQREAEATLAGLPKPV